MSTAPTLRNWHLGRAAVVAGACGSVLMTITGPSLVGSAGGQGAWWFTVHVPPGRTGDMVGFYVGIVALAGAWLALGRRLAREPETTPRELWAVAALWGLPLLFGPALFSGDMYSYLAQGEIVHLGLDPYHVAPQVLAHLGHQRILDGVSPFWRGTTAPYGPLFLGIASVVVGATGANLVAGVIVLRCVEVAGVVLLAVFVPRLARAFGADPARATWLAVASPLVLLQLVAAGHNDALMAGCMVAGAALAVERRPLLAVACCTLAATVKVPAFVVAAFVAVAWARDLPPGRARTRFLAAAAATVVVVAGAVSAATGLGLRWISTTLVSTPGKVHLAITPITAFAWTVAKLLHGAGVAVDYRHLQTALGDVTLAATALLALVLLGRARGDRAVTYAAAVLVAAALGGPAAWPWYFCWGLVLLAAWRGAQRSVWLALAVALSVLLVKPDGILALPLQSSPGAVVLYLAVAAVAVVMWRRRFRNSAPGAAAPEAHVDPAAPGAPDRAPVLGRA